MKTPTLLEKLDLYLAKKKSSEIRLINTMILILLFFLSYQYLFPLTEEMVKKSKAKKQEIAAKISEDNAYLDSVTLEGDREYYVKLYTKEIGDFKEQFANLKKKNEYTDYQIHTLSQLLYTDQNWAKFLDSIALKAKKYNIDINYIKNTFVQNTESFGHVLEIEVDCSGDYKNMVSFINSMEQSELVVDIYGMHLASKAVIEANFKVSVWGINY